MRCWFVVVALAGCLGHGTTGPSWPSASHASSAGSSDKDGGESLAPHESRQVVTAIEKSDDEPKVAAPVATAVTASAAIDVGTPAIAPAMSAPIEETITSEEIVIEINDD
jgi:hypothetical protein